MLVGPTWPAPNARLANARLVIALLATLLSMGSGCRWLAGYAAADDPTRDRGLGDVGQRDAGLTPDRGLADSTPTYPDAGITSAPPLACRAGTWCWEHPLPQGNDLLAVHCLGSGECWAAGRKGALVARDPATGDWQRYESGTSGDLHAIWVGEAPERQIVVAGAAGLLRRWRSSSGWETITTSGVGPAGTLDALWLLDNGEVLVGNATAGLWRRSAAGDWAQLRPEPLKALAGTPKKAYAVLSLDTGGEIRDRVVDIIGGGKPGILAYSCLEGPLVDVAAPPGSAPFEVYALSASGEVFGLQAINTCVELTGDNAEIETARALWVASPGELLVVGQDDEGKHLLSTFDGSIWSSKTVPRAAFDIGGGGPDRVAVGAHGSLFERGATGWADVSARQTSQTLRSAALAAGSLYAGGDGPTLLVRTGKAWQLSPLDSQLQGPIAALAGDASELYGVDGGDALFRLAPTFAKLSSTSIGGSELERRPV